MSCPGTQRGVVGDGRAAEGHAAVAELERGRDCASATTLDISGTYTSWVVYSEMKARWRCWRPDAGGDTLVRAHNSSDDDVVDGVGLHGDQLVHHNRGFVGTQSRVVQKWSSERR